MSSTDRFTMRFWGVRGSIPTPGPRTARYGGNTSCVEVRCGDRLLIIDAGTGVRALGATLPHPVSADLFFSHVHWDHIQGFPFFSPVFRAGNTFRLHGQALDGTDLRAVLGGQMSYPTFPVTLEQLGAKLSFHELRAGESRDLGDGIQLDTRPLNHPGGSVGMRFTYKGRSLVHCSDTEHPAEGFDDNVTELCAGADWLSYDASYCQDEYLGRQGPCRVGWGHSTWEEAVRVARHAAVKNLVLFHHDYTHDDEQLDDIHARARSRFPDTHMAVEGMTIDLLSGTIVSPGA